MCADIMLVLDVPKKVRIQLGTVPAQTWAAALQQVILHY